MTTWNQRFLPYPLLSPYTSDYTNATWTDDNETFSADAIHHTRDNKGNINLTIKYNLNSAYLRQLIDSRQAKYTSVIFCSRTFKRFSTEPSPEEDEDIIVEAAAQYADHLELTPYVIATTEIDNFLSEEHVEEIRMVNPDGYKITPWSILAVGKSTEISLERGDSLESVIDLVGDRAIKEDGAFKIALDENRIKIYVSQNDKTQIDLLRQKEFSHPAKAALFSAIYLHAIIEALRNLPEHEDRAWHNTLRKAISDRNIQADDDNLKEFALVHAQTLMDNPIGMFLKAHLKE